LSDRGRAAGVATLRAALAAALVLAAAAPARSQDAGATPPMDAIFARKTLMNAIDMNMEELETMLAPGGRVDAAEAREHADTISIMLMAFPHLFPAGTNLWKPNVDRDPATDTYASPELWANFADFYRRATEASKLAGDASRAERGEQFRALIAQLRVACNSCHAAYQKTD